METHRHNTNDGSQAFSNKTLGEIAVALPGSTAVFRRHKLDFCCGGKESLKAAAERRNLDLASIESELAVLRYEVATILESVPQILERIVERYHNVHRHELPELRWLAMRIEKVHKDHPELPVGLVDCITDLSDELLDHMDKEEQVLFIMMKTGGNPMIKAPIAMMRHEHDEHGAQIHKLAEMTNDFQPPAGACNTWRALYSGLQKLSDDLMEHIHLENNVLFEHFER